LLNLSKKYIGAKETFEEKVKFKEQVYTFARGGIHNEIENKQYHSDDTFLLIDVDVTSYYVATILLNKLSPKHLNKAAFTKAYKWIYDNRVKLKPLAKKDNRIKGIVSGLKEAGVSVYGKSGDIDSWLYDLEMLLTTCISGELSILSLIESHELDGSKAIMANTDGATFIVKRSNLTNFYKICNDWCTVTNYQLEYFEFKSMWFLNVNNYIAIKQDGEIKRKGQFSIDFIKINLKELYL
jgi:DNA polymerase elongation subunit (family B)